jgi:hypothetical protein
VSDIILDSVATPAERRGWSQLELAHLERAAKIFRYFGLPLETDSGETDEGDPWLVFCYPESDEVFAHFARIDVRYVVVAPAIHGSLSGRELPDVVARFLEAIQAGPPARRSTAHRDSRMCMRERKGSHGAVRATTKRA